MGEPPRRVATYQDVLDAPEHLTAEILNGELHLTPRPAYEHAEAASGALTGVRGRFGHRGGSGPGPGGWVILMEPELHLGPAADPSAEVVVPDLAGWRRERFVRPDGVGHTVRPDWVCEVLSPGSRNIRRDRILKTAIYHRSDIAWYWIIDPLAHTVEVFRHTPEGYLLDSTFAGHVPAGMPPFDAEEIDLSDWWSEGPDEEDTR